MAIDFDRLTTARKELNLTKTDLANILNLPVRTYSSYELGERDPSTEVLLKICKVLDLSADELLGMSSAQVIKKVATINGKLVYMIPIFDLDSNDFKMDFIDCMPWFFEDMNEAKLTFAVKAIGDSMYPKIEKDDILVIYKQERCHEDDIVLIRNRNKNMLRRANLSRRRLIFEAINPTYPPIDATGELKKEVEIIGVVKKIIRTP